MFTVFNPNGSDLKGDRQVWNGNSTGIINLNNVKFEWATQLWRQMRENFWVAEKVDLSTDVPQYTTLLPEEQRAYDGILSYLVFLDSVQVQNIPHLVRPCSSPEIAMCFSEQLSQETLHAQSYQYIIETIIPVEKREQIYSYWKDDDILFNRCQLIGSYYQEYIDNPNKFTHVKALVADYILEGLYFYVGFCFYYNLGFRTLMCGTADVFRLINRDELSHVRLYQKLLQDVLQQKELRDYVEAIAPSLFREAVEQEILWSKHIIGDKIIGFPIEGIENYVKYLADIRLNAIGLGKLYGIGNNPFAHLEKTADITKEASIKANFFDGTNTSYQMAHAVEGWDEI